MLIRIIDPLLQLCLVHNRACRIVGEAQIDQIRHLFRQVWYKPILRCTGHVDHFVKSPCLRIVITRSARHYIGIHIDRIDRITHSNLVRCVKNLLYIAAVALRAVRNEDLLRRDLTSSGLEILARDHIPQELIAQVRRITAETLRTAHLIDGSMQSINNCRCNGLRHISDPEPDDLRLRICRREIADLFPNC